MHEYITGQLVELSPTYAVVENNGIAYFIRISLQTYAKLREGNDVKLFIESIIREDSYSLYGFFDKNERTFFRLLISVSGVGANTANMMLSAMDTKELQQAVLTENVVVIKNIKGIGVKTAQRIIVDLKDKISKNIDIDHIFTHAENNVREEAISALAMLGFSKIQCRKVLDNILKKEQNISIEDLIKKALKQL